jgi:hypothetical protein
MDTTTTLPGKMIFPESIKPWRSIGAKPGNRYKIVTMHIAAPADLSDDKIVEALNFALTNTYVDEAAPLADDWQFLARDGAVGDNDHFREAIIPTDDLFAGTPQAIFENWYLVPEGVQCPQCERFFTAPEDIAAIGDHALCTTCLVAWRVTAAARQDDGDGYSEQPPFLPIPEWWAARGLAVPADDAATPLTIEQVKETLPYVQVEYRGKTYTAKVRGRRNPLAEVAWDTDCGALYADFAWETVTNAINSGKMLKA